MGTAPLPGPPPRPGLKAASPGADEDCNSNTSLAGSQHDDLDAHCDNSGYLWFLDYNPIFRDSSCHHTSVLSSVSASYKGISDLTSRFEFTSRYNDIARDLDANLAEADMESFRTEDIHALLMTANLPRDAGLHDDRPHDRPSPRAPPPGVGAPVCPSLDPGLSNPRGEMFASISSSLMEKFRFDSLSVDSSFQASATADGLAPEGASQTKKFCLQVIKKRPRKKFCLQVIKKRPRKPDVADVHEWCSAATVNKT
ncbi:hypothetical protein EVAR_20074_1 [Eumeta japonica]|uniref:Uncharacterized protein n=1 Tax=Eumeta variegata TaxID=151549 RepID=A0A4C1UIA8_EUMVA|nr:hypothetical protein EVAR_20074_1 [Eumeta japonica]